MESFVSSLRHVLGSAPPPRGCWPALVLCISAHNACLHAILCLSTVTRCVTGCVRRCSTAHTWLLTVEMPLQQSLPEFRQELILQYALCFVLDCFCCNELINTVKVNPWVHSRPNSCEIHEDRSSFVSDFYLIFSGSPLPLPCQSPFHIWSILIYKPTPGNTVSHLQASCWWRWLLKGTLLVINWAT